MLKMSTCSICVKTTSRLYIHPIDLDSWFEPMHALHDMNSYCKRPNYDFSISQGSVAQY